VTGLNITLTRFFGLSLAIHAAAFGYLMLIQKAALPPRSAPPPIAVSLLPPGEKEPAAAAPAATEVSKTPAPVAKTESRIPAKDDARPSANKARQRPRRETNEKAVLAAAKNSAAEPTRDEAATGVPIPTSAATKPEIPLERSIVAERQLPTVKELLPPITYSSSGTRGSAPVSLNTKDPAYVSYFNRIKQAIEINWEYPELAKRYGLQGKLALEFTIAADGQLEQLRLVRSSGSQLLDDEALRAIKAAAPFPRIPSWIKGSPLPISASMEYSDSRLNYR